MELVHRVLATEICYVVFSKNFNVLVLNCCYAITVVPEYSMITYILPTVWILCRKFRVKILTLNTG